MVMHLLHACPWAECWREERNWDDSSLRNVGRGKNVPSVCLYGGTSAGTVLGMRWCRKGRRDARAQPGMLWKALLNKLKLCDFVSSAVGGKTENRLCPLIVTKWVHRKVVFPSQTFSIPHLAGWAFSSPGSSGSAFPLTSSQASHCCPPRRAKSPAFGGYRIWRRPSWAGAAWYPVSPSLLPPSLQIAHCW